MAAKYTVTDVQQRQRFTPGGQKVSYYDVYITTAHGASGTLRVDAKDYDKKTLPGLLDGLADTLDMAFTI